MDIPTSGHSEWHNCTSGPYLRKYLVAAIILITLIINILKFIIMHSSALLTSGLVLRSLLGPLLVMKPEHIAAYCYIQAVSEIGDN